MFIGNQANGYLMFQTNATERARIISSGYFKATDNGTYESSTGTQHEFYQSANSETLRVVNANASFTNDVMQVWANRNTTNNTFYAINYYNKAASAYKFRVADSGAIATAGSISLGTVTPATSGVGVQFPATQSASSDANTLDDYEEGTWTPTVTASTSGTITTTDRGGTYTKIGNIVTVQGYFNVASVSSPVGDLRIGGLPFTISSSVGYGSVSLQPYGFGTTSVVTAYYGLQLSNQTYFAIRGLFNGAQVTTVANNVQASTGMQFTVTYQV
jgi:hypothetical protein